VSACHVVFKMTFLLHNTNHHMMSFQWSGIGVFALSYVTKNIWSTLFPQRLDLSIYT